MNFKSTSFSVWDLIVQSIYFRFLIQIISVLVTQFLIIFIYKPQYLLLNWQGFSFVSHILSLPIFYICLYVFFKLVNSKSSSHFTHTFKESYTLVLEKYPEYNLRKMPIWKRSLKVGIQTLIIMNIFVLIPILYLIQQNFFHNSLQPIYEYLYSGTLSGFADPRLYIFMAIQLLHVLILLYWIYKRTQNLISHGFKEMVEERYNSEEAKEYPAYSRFWLYAFPIAVLLLWIFIHPLSLLLIKAMH